MRKNKIENTDLEISPITLGTWVFGGHFWGGANEDDCIKAVHCAIDHGINCIDTAPIYSNGQSEIIVGKAIKGKRDKVVIATKCGLKVEGKKILNDLSPATLTQEIEDSLARLQTDFIDIYQCHWPDESTPIEKTMETLSQLREQGKIRHIGLSNHGLELFKKALAVTNIVTSQDQYSLLVRDVEEQFLPFLRENKIGLLAYGPLAGGILTGKYQTPPAFKNADARKFFYKFYEGKNFEETQNFIKRLQEFGKPLNQLAINWVRAQEGVASVLVGSRSAQQVEENIKALDWELTSDELGKMDEILKETVYG